nr:glycine oxidase ThiO [Prochlorococcus sp. MIT 1341]
MNTKPLLILGGGLMGLALAHQLARKGRSVLVLSRSRSEAAGFVAAGMLAPHAEGLQGDLLGLGELSLERIPEWVSRIESDSGIQCGLRFCGVVTPFMSAHERDLFSTSSSGIMLNRLQLKKELPGIASHWKYGLLFPQDGQIDNRRRLMRALEKACVCLGVQFQEGVEVLELLHEHELFKGVKVRSAEGQLEIFSAEEAVLCSGAWSSQLLKELPIFPVKGQMMSVQGPKDALRRVIFGRGTYMVPRDDGLIVVGATSEPEVGFVDGLTPYGQQSLQKGMSDLLPDASQWPPMERWWGFRPCTPDEGPLLGSSSIEGLWLAAGHHRNGVLLAAITSELIANLILGQCLTGQELNFLEAFRWDRFED